MDFVASNVGASGARSNESGPELDAAWIRGLRRWAWSLAHNGPRWTLRHVKVFGGLR